MYTFLICLHCIFGGFCSPRGTQISKVTLAYWGSCGYSNADNYGCVWKRVHDPRHSSLRGAVITVRFGNGIARGNAIAEPVAMTLHVVSVKTAIIIWLSFVSPSLNNNEVKNYMRWYQTKTLFNMLMPQPESLHPEAPVQCPGMAHGAATDNDRQKPQKSISLAESRQNRQNPFPCP